MEFKAFPSKVLLFGEYSILSGSNALVIPYQGFTGRLEFATQLNDSMTWESNRVIRQMVHYLEEVHNKWPSELTINLHRLHADLEKGLFFVSSIPRSYGLGSSGALCAAIFDAYSNDQVAHQPLASLRQCLSLMESFFHRTSSGIDPLCIYTGRPLLIRSGSDIEVWKFPNTETDVSCWLADTGEKADTGQLVDRFRSQLSKSEYSNRICQDYIPLVNLAVDAMVAGTLQMTELLDISNRQFDLFPEMIPSRVRKIWQFGIETGDYACKLCGSGGGGMMLVFTQNPDLTVRNFDAAGFGNMMPLNLKGFM